MFQLVKMIPRVIIKKVATFPPFTGSDLDRYTVALDALEPACDTYMEMLSNDEVDTKPADIIDLRDLIREMNQAVFFDFLDVLDEMRDYIVEKVELISAQKERKEEDADVLNTPNGEETEENGSDDQGGLANGGDGD